MIEVLGVLRLGEGDGGSRERRKRRRGEREGFGCSLLLFWLLSCMPTGTKRMEEDMCTFFDCGVSCFAEFVCVHDRGILCAQKWDLKSRYIYR